MSTTAYYRQSLRLRRKALSSVYVAKISRLISEKIIAMPLFSNAQHIAYYLSDENEVDLSYVAQCALALKKTLYLPVISEARALKFYRVDENTQYQKNKFGILEPISNHLMAINQLDLMLIPLVAFDKNCHRVGRGLGCYDRSLQETHQCKLMGVAYDFQKTALIKPEKWDVLMDYIVTEDANYTRRQ